MNWEIEYNRNYTILEIVIEKHLYSIANNICYFWLMDLRLHRMHIIYWHFEDLEYLNMINIQYLEILSNVTERGCWKLPCLESKDVRLGRSIFNYFISFHYYFALLMNMMNHCFRQVHHNRVEWIVMMEDLLQSFHSNSFNTFHYCC